MKGLFTVFNYELNQHIRKSVIVATIVLALILFGIPYPRLIPLFSGSGSRCRPKDISYGYVLAQELGQKAEAVRAAGKAL